MNINFREANVNDISQIQVIRNLVKENVLSDPSRITDSDCAEYLAGRGKGWVCEINDKIVGFAIADLKEKNIWALFMDPLHERKGIGKRLHDMMVDWYFSETDQAVWLSTDPGTRAEAFYRKAGWKEIGIYGKQEIKFEMSRNDWFELKRNQPLNTQLAYNKWSQSYDEVINRTRDLEGKALRELLSERRFNSVLEIGCGTGKNTVWFKDNCSSITAVDLSEEMLGKAKSKISSDNVRFIQANINSEWNFAVEKFDLITFSLVLEHISDLGHIFSQASGKLNENGIVYVGELHPFKQYTGSKARFETENGIQIVDCFNHHISDFTDSAMNAGLELEILKEYFDDDDRNQIPRILAIIFKKKSK
ncbi:MAG: GNAT family N-acetyltransferase [Bacteroidota bacterium]